MKHPFVFLFVSLALLPLAELAYSQTPAAGQIVEKVVCAADSTQSYALYLPSSYSQNKRWPVLYAFDPGARGTAPVERFKDAAEKYGYIVAGSNNSRNGPWGPTLAAIRAMWEDTHARFSIEDNRVYVTGFSGGSRVACQIGYMLKGGVAGVIACGAGFPPDITPSNSTPFVLFGVAGVEDFNYPELKRLETSLDAAGIANRFATFEGGHSWPPSDVCVKAIEWMDLQAMKSGKRERSDAIVDALLKENGDNAHADEAAGRLYQAYLAYSAAARDFKGLRDAAEFEKKAASLRESKAVKQAIKQELEQESEQRTRVRELFRLRAALRDRRVTLALADREETPREPGGMGSGGMGSGAGSGAMGSGAMGAAPLPQSLERPTVGDDGDPRQFAMADLKRALADLKKRSEAKAVTPQRALARRVLNEFTIGSYELSSALIRSKRYDLAAANLAIDAALTPGNVRVQYNLACAYALAGDKKKAIDALKKAVYAGFDRVGELDGNRDLDSLREERAFKEIVDQLKNKR